MSIVTFHKANSFIDCMICLYSVLLLLLLLFFSFILYIFCCPVLYFIKCCLVRMDGWIDGYLVGGHVADGAVCLHALELIETPVEVIQNVDR